MNVDHTHCIPITGKRADGTPIHAYRRDGIAPDGMRAIIVHRHHTIATTKVLAAACGYEARGEDETAHALRETAEVLHLIAVQSVAALSGAYRFGAPARPLP